MQEICVAVEKLATQRISFNKARTNSSYRFLASEIIIKPEIADPAPVKDAAQQTRTRNKNLGWFELVIAS